MPPLELWGGIECTVNRVGDTYFDQLERSGHLVRDSDLDLIAELGIRVLRYPVLWEHVAPREPATMNWSGSDARLGKLHELGIEPIVGLLHHGSGPRYTSLLDDEFPLRFARYARAVAERYPWVRMYTPINEPLTTARFSTLYGHWFPHARSDVLFARAVVNQLRAVSLAMREIRTVNPRAELVQTEDTGRSHATPGVLYQAEFENERRWLTFDVLCGKLNESSRMWQFLAWAGVPQWQLRQLVDERCAPHILGINYYLTSERFLSDSMTDFPECTCGSNGRHKYVDVEALRVLRSGWNGPEGTLVDAAERYGAAQQLAITEAHAGATREDQLRWLHEVWTAACRLRSGSVNVRAVTAWSLLGAYDWNTLVTRREGHYEVGAFDVRSGSPRPTAVSRMIRDVATKGTHSHPILDGAGWWRREQRLFQRAVGIRPIIVPRIHNARPGSRPVLIAGATGTLGRAFAAVCLERDISYQLCSRLEMDITAAASVKEMLAAVNPWAVINAAGYVRVDDAEREMELCFRCNRDGPAILARECEGRGIPLLTFSTDLVFDGVAARPYVEGDAVAPLGVYGRSKAEAELAVLRDHLGALVVRTSAFFGPWDEYNFAARVLRAARQSGAVEGGFAAAFDETVSPTFVPDLAHTALDLLLDGANGIWHIANQGALSWHDFARLVLERAALDTSILIACAGCELPRRALRPAYSVLGTTRGAAMATIENAIDRFIAARSDRARAA